MIHRYHLAGVLLTALAAACGGSEPPVAELPAASRVQASSSILRLPTDGGVARLYRLPALDEAQWKAHDRLPAVKRPIGPDLDQGLVYVLDQKNNVVALDLASRRVRTYLSQVRHAELGPDGSLFAVDTGSSVTQLVRRSPVRFRTKLKGTPRALFATMNGTLLAPVGGKEPGLEVLGSDQQPTTVDLPEGQVAATYWGDLVAVAAGSDIVLYEPQGRKRRETIDAPIEARAVLFSPSGHRLYVAGAGDELLVYERWGRDLLERIELPGPATALRGDLYGSWLLVRPEGKDSVWVVNPNDGRFVGSVAARWGQDLPAVSAPNMLLVRRGGDLVSLDLSREGFPETGRVKGGGDDWWMPVAWLPGEEPKMQATDSAEAEVEDSLGPRARIYLQVSSSQNPAWANELAAKLKAAGLPASVLPPKQTEEAYRVVLGPYPTREQAEASGRGLGMPSFVITLPPPDADR